MEPSPYPFLDPKSRVARNISVRAKRLAFSGSVPGVDEDDVRQELLLHLVKRHQNFDPARASYDTFADRVIANRVASLAKSSHALRGARASVSVETPVGGRDGEDAFTLSDVLDESSALYNAPHRTPETVIALTLDVRRMIAKLSPQFRKVAEALLQFDVRDVPDVLGLHRSTVYERIRHIRMLASAQGLDDYFGATPRQFCSFAGK